MEFDSLISMIDIQEKIDKLQREFDQLKENGVTDFNKLNEINTLRDKLEAMENSCDLDDEGCLTCGS